jgi:hypothetical protein
LHYQLCCYHFAVNISSVVAQIDQEISRLQQVRALLTQNSVAPRRGRPRVSAAATPTKRHTMSAEGRARIAAAQKKRWAKQKAAPRQAAKRKSAKA